MSPHDPRLTHENITKALNANRDFHRAYNGHPTPATPAHTINATFTDASLETIALLSGMRLLDVIDTPQNKDAWRRAKLTPGPSTPITTGAQHFTSPGVPAFPPLGDTVRWPTPDRIKANLSTDEIVPPEAREHPTRTHYLYARGHGKTAIAAEVFRNAHPEGPITELPQHIKALPDEEQGPALVRDIHKLIGWRGVGDKAPKIIP